MLSPSLSTCNMCIMQHAICVLCNLQYTYQTGPLHCVTLRQSIAVCYHVRDLNIMMINKMIMLRYLKVSGGLGTAINGQQEEVLDERSTDSAQCAVHRQCAAFIIIRSRRITHQAPSTIHQAPSTIHQAPSTKHQAPYTKHQTPNAMHSVTLQCAMH